MNFSISNTEGRGWLAGLITVEFHYDVWCMKQLTSTAAYLLEVQASDEAQQRDSSVLRQPQLPLQGRLALRLACTRSRLGIRTAQRRAYLKRRSIDRRP